MPGDDNEALRSERAMRTLMDELRLPPRRKRKMLRKQKHLDALENPMGKKKTTRKKRFKKLFYDPLRKLGVKISDGDCYEIAKEVVRIEMREKHVRDRQRSQAKNLKKQCDAALEKIRLEVDSEVSS